MKIQSYAISYKTFNRESHGWYAERYLYAPNCMVTYPVRLPAVQNAISRGQRLQASVAGLNECVPNPCHNQGKCFDNFDRFYCVCPFEYSGPTCSENLGSCKKNSCDHGDCVQLDWLYHTCIWKPGWRGKTCSSRSKIRIKTKVPLFTGYWIPSLPNIFF